MNRFFPAVCTAPLLRFAFSFLLLMVYSFLGWCGEMVYCSLCQRRLCEKRGFLNGPICPIYGHGAIVVLLCLDGGCENPLLTFLLGAVLTSVVEYATSYVMEALFHMRWWDYSQFRFHLNGRVCLLNSVLFGLASVFLCHAANPPVSGWLADLLASGAGVPLALILAAVYLADVALSVRGAIRIGDRLARLHAIQDELAGKLEGLRQEQEQRASALLQTVEARAAETVQTVQSRLEPLAERGDEFAARLEEARAEAQQKLRALYEKQDFFERRLLRAFPALESRRHGDALKKWREYLENRKNITSERKGRK